MLKKLFAQQSVYKFGLFSSHVMGNPKVTRQKMRNFDEKY